MTKKEVRKRSLSKEAGIARMLAAAHGQPLVEYQTLCMNDMTAPTLQAVVET